MKKLGLLAVLLSGLVGCGAAPEPTGPAAQAPTDDIEITIDSPSSGSEVAAANLEELRLEVPGMACEINCPPTVRKTLQEVPGVAKVDVDFATKTATCQVDKSKFDAAIAVEKLAEVGFKDSKLKN